MSRTRWATGLLALAASVASVSGCAVGLQDIPLAGARGTFEVTAELTTADGVVDGSDVRNGQQVVGRVTDIGLEGNDARLTLALDDGTELPANVLATVEIPSALGTPFIRLTAPEHPEGRLADGDHIELSETSVGPQVEGTLAALGNILQGSGMSQMQSVMASLGEAFENRSDEVGTLIDTLNRLLSRSSHYTADFNAAMSAAADVTDVLAGQRNLVDQFLAQTPAAVTVLAKQRQQLVRLMDQTTSLARSADAIVTGRQPQLNSLVTDANTLVNSLASFNSGVGETLGHMNSFMTNFNRSIRGDYLVFDGALDIPGGIDKILTGGILLAGQPLPTPKDLRDALTGGLASATGQGAPAAGTRRGGH
ncbi:MCE family protein [Gordonia sp. NB41Y]|uniref:MCE family protein n=1 Tax=Gordonia sp. NB41Y TaxID=875808 RepID=UPI0002BDE0E2|nr:MCE family protein [Gordonia sp. NB41Y]EMP12695.1 mammalian cell entry protein [Gordonia sp. NB41Y]WLP88812.1 MCE family protein [Gordonia sp. NB41Y]